MAQVLGEKLERRLRRALGEAIELADLGGQHIASHKIAGRVFDSEPALMAELHRPWAIDRLTWMIAEQRRERYGGSSLFGAQMVLPDPVFQGLPRSVFLHNGQRPKLDDCKLPQVRDHLRLLRERFDNSPRVRQMEAVVELHEKWAARSRNITWGQAKQREAEERSKS